MENWLTGTQTRFHTQLSFKKVSESLVSVAHLMFVSEYQRGSTLSFEHGWWHGRGRLVIREKAQLFQHYISVSM